MKQVKPTEVKNQWFVHDVHIQRRVCSFDDQKVSNLNLRRANKSTKTIPKGTSLQRASYIASRCSSWESVQGNGGRHECILAIHLEVRKHLPCTPV